MSPCVPASLDAMMESTDNAVRMAAAAGHNGSGPLAGA